MNFVSLVEFDGTSANAHDTEGVHFLVDVNQIKRVTVKVKRSEKTDAASYKWLAITYLDGTEQDVCPIGEGGGAMAPTSLKDEEDGVIARCAAVALEGS